VTANICLGRETLRFGLLDWRAMHNDAQALLGRFNPNIDLRRPPGQFSTATQQMIAIARAIGFSARLMVMNEPTSSLDDREAGVLFDVARQLRAGGLSVIFVSHKLDELHAICDRFSIMRDGRSVHRAALSEIGKLDFISTMPGREISRTASHTTAFGEAQVPAPGPALFTAEGLSDGRHLRQVGFALRKGEITRFAGLLGAGRTETARMMSCASKPIAGRMMLDGAPFAPRQPADAIAAGIGFCTEDRKIEGIVPDMTVAENMMSAMMPKLARAGIVNEPRQRDIVAGFNENLWHQMRGAQPEDP